MKALDKIRIKVSNAPVETFKDVALLWWKKYCWNHWKNLGTNYGDACDDARKQHINSSIGLYVHSQWENSAWQYDLADWKECSEEEIKDLFSEMWGLDTVEKIRAELEWSKVNQRFRIPLMPITPSQEVADDFIL